MKPPPPRLKRRHATVIGATLCLLFTLSAAGDPFSRTFTHGDVTVTFVVDPPRVDPGSDTELSITVETPPDHEASLPADLSDRFDGFSVAGSYRTDGGDGTGTRTWHYRLIPAAGAPQYRIRPIAVTVKNTALNPPETRWFPTERIRLDVPAIDETVPRSVDTRLAPRRIRPSFKTAPRYIGYGVLAVALLVLLGHVISRIRLAQKIRRMSPKERALRELDRLLKRRLAEQGLFKDFYVELTMVVRRYIERCHGIRAPEQTTEEFLAAATGHTAFDPTSLSELKQFLNAADLVKFAGAAATVSSAAEATEKARAYINHTDGTPPPPTRPEDAR